MARPDRTEPSQVGYDKLINDAAAVLSEDEFWCVVAPDGQPIPFTLDKRLDEPVIRFCDELNCDWDEATDEGFSLGRCRRISP